MTQAHTEKHSATWKIIRMLADAPEIAAERDRLKVINEELLAALSKAQSALYAAGHHHGISGVMIAVDNAIDRAKK